VKNPVPQLAVRNRQRNLSVNTAALQNFAAKALRRSFQLHIGKPTDLRRLSEVFVWLVSDRRMAQLHRKFMQLSGATDVITFQHGEIFISVETANRNARRFGNSLEHELRLYIVHGFLHLHGFDDRTEAAARKMQKAQEKILATCSRNR
jgi:probable rRNA maturation factor